jgi:hypothetical protein
VAQHSSRLQVKFLIDNEHPEKTRWELRWRRSSKHLAPDSKRAIGPSFSRVRVIVLCRNASGRLFLLCS